MRASYDGVQIETIGGFGLLLEIVGIVLWRSFDVFGQFARETRAGFHAPAERLDEAAIALPAAGLGRGERGVGLGGSEEHTSELQSLMRISYAVFCLKNKTQI